MTLRRVTTQPMNGRTVNKVIFSHVLNFYEFYTAEDRQRSKPMLSQYMYLRIVGNTHAGIARYYVIKAAWVRCVRAFRSSQVCLRSTARLCQRQGRRLHPPPVLIR